MYTCVTHTKPMFTYLFQKMKPVILLLFLVAAPHATRTALVPPARSVHHQHHVSASPPYHLEPLPTPRYTTTPYPLQQSTPTPAQPSTAPPARPLSIACDPDEAPSPPTFVTRYPTPHTFRSKTNPPANHCHMLPPPQYKNMYFHIPMHINPMIHTPQTKKKTRTRSAAKRIRQPTTATCSLPLSIRICTSTSPCTSTPSFILPRLKRRPAHVPHPADALMYHSSHHPPPIDFSLPS